jgi:hypothetical protein
VIVLVVGAVVALETALYALLVWSAGRIARRGVRQQ